MTTDYFYTASDNMSTLVTAHPELLLTLSHFDIALGFGDKTIAQVCQEHDVDPNFFLLITQVYTDDKFIPTQAMINSTPMVDLIPYLVRSHDYYLNRRLPHIKGHLAKIASLLPKRAGNAIKQFFDAYVSEVEAHFAHEENTVYPHIIHLLNKQAGDDYMIKDYLSHHDNLDDKLSDLVQIIFKYLPASSSSPSKLEGGGGSMSTAGASSSPSKLEGVGGSMSTAAEKVISDDDDAIDMIFDILQLSRDLRKHSLIEDKILGPYVKQLEKHYSAR